MLEGSVEYRRDTEAVVRTVEETYRAEAVVLGDGSVRLTSSSGPCREFRFGRSRQGLVPRRRVFWCNDVNYVLQPGEETIRGELRVWVLEAVQGQGICRRYAIVSGKEVCVDYPLEVQEHAVDKTAPLTVVEKGPAGDTIVWSNLIHSDVSQVLDEVPVGVNLPETFDHALGNVHGAVTSIQTKAGVEPSPFFPKEMASGLLEDVGGIAAATADMIFQFLGPVCSDNPCDPTPGCCIPFNPDTGFGCPGGCSG